MGIADHELRFRLWLGEHKGLLVKVVRSFAEGPADQDDLFQEILLQVWLSLPNFRNDSKPTTWLYRVAFNTALAWKRTEKKRQGRQGPLSISDVAGPSGSSAEAEQSNRIVEQLYAAIRALPPAKRALVVLYLDGFSYREIADVVGISESNVGVSLNRIKKELSASIKERATMNALDKLQQAWQSQCFSNKPLDISPGQLLKGVRFERRAILMIEMVMMLILIVVGIGMLWWGVRDIHEDWPWLIYSATDAWVVGFMLYKQWSRRRHAPRYDEPLLAHVEWSIKDIESRMRQARDTFWWYTLPLALGCVIPSAVSFVMIYIKKPGAELLIVMLFGLLFTFGFFPAFFYFLNRFMTKWILMGNERYRRELESLWSLRETLLNAEE